MISSILRFDFFRRLRRVSTYVYFLVYLGLGFLFVLASGGGLPNITVDFGTGGRVMINSPYALALVIAYVSFFGVVTTAAIAGQATYQDVDARITDFFYTAPISKFQYLAGRFLAALAIQAVIFTSVGLGAWIATLMPWMDPARLGPQNLSAYLQPYLILVLPNIIFLTDIFFSLAALGRKMLPVYAGGILLLIGYFVATQLSANLTVNTLAALADPFGGNALDRVTQYWTPFQRNAQIVPLASTLLLNRLLWLTVGAVILGFTYFKFAFAYPAQKGRRRLESNGVEIIAAARSLPRAKQTFSLPASVSELVSLTQLQFFEVVKNVFFAVLVLAGFLSAVMAGTGLGSPFSTPFYPLTYRMLEAAGGTFSLFVLAIVTFYSGELVWRERDTQVNQIVDAMPVQHWVLFGAKLLALMLVQVILVLVILAAGLTVQLVQDYHRFQLGLYSKELFGIRLVGFWTLCVIALLIHTIVNNKYLGHFIIVLYYIVLIALPPMGFQHYLYRFGQSPTFIYSDMNGYGPFAAPLFWFHLYWGVAAIFLAIVVNLLWIRGVDTGLRGRIRLALSRLNSTSRIGLTACALLFITLGAYIFYNTNILNPYRTTFQNDEARAQYEKQYRQYKSMPEPRITDVKVDVDLYPEKHFARLRGTLWLENKTWQPLDRIAVTIWPEDLQPLPRPHLQINELSLAGGQKEILHDPAHGFFIFQLPSPLLPHARIALEFDLAYPNPGFVNSNPNTDITSNGSFLNNSYIPAIGYFDDVELPDDSIRRRHGLPTPRQVPKLEDVSARQNYFFTDADWINFEGTVSTDPDQTAIMPGYLQKEWMENGRRYFHYKMDAPILNIFDVNSARYAVQRDHWRNVNLEIYYQPGHEFNLERMQRSMKAALDYCSAAFSPYQFRQVRIIEFPRYANFAESFPNTIPYSESIGFITRVDPKDHQAIDLPFYVTAHEVAHQWWAHQVVSAHMEGETSIVETLAQYSALMVMQHTYGADSMRKFLRYELEGYLRGRAQEHNQEKPLYKVDPNQGYIHYNKGGLVMYALQDYIGEENVNRGLADLVKDYGFKGPPYPTSLDLIAHLQRYTPPQFMYLYDDWFKNITLYENRAVSATYTETVDGKYKVHLNVEARKYHSDGAGRETQVPSHDLIDVGIQDNAGHYLYLQKQEIDRENEQFDLTVDKKPGKAGIDPLSKLIDRKPEDNIVKVEKK